MVAICHNMDLGDSWEHADNPAVSREIFRARNSHCAQLPDLLDDALKRTMNWSSTGAILLALAVILGAFGAHGLRDRLDAYSMSVYEKAVFYHFIHGLGLLIVSLPAEDRHIFRVRHQLGLRAAAGGNRDLLRQPVRAGGQRQPHARAPSRPSAASLHRRLADARLVPHAPRVGTPACPLRLLPERQGSRRHRRRQRNRLRGRAPARRKRRLRLDLRSRSRESFPRREQIGAHASIADVTSRESLDAAFARSGAPDILIANAGIGEEQDFLDHTAETWERFSPSISPEHSIPCRRPRVMKRRRSGAIVLTASTNSYDGESRLTAYNASKAGLLGLSTAANELGPYQIRVNAVCPGLIRTRLTERHFSQPRNPPRLLPPHPARPRGDPEEVQTRCSSWPPASPHTSPERLSSSTVVKWPPSSAPGRKPQAHFQNARWSLKKRPLPPATTVIDLSTLRPSAV